MDEMSKHGKVGLAAMRAGMDRKTARKYVKSAKLPSERKGHLQHRPARLHQPRLRRGGYHVHWHQTRAPLGRSPRGGLTG